MKEQNFETVWRRPLPVDETTREGAVEEFQVHLFRAARRANAENERVLFALANQLTRTGHHEEALEVDRRLVELHGDNPIYRYNLACSYSNLGRIDRAIGELSSALEKGYLDLQHIESDPDLENVRQDPRYEELVEEHFSS